MGQKRVSINDAEWKTVEDYFKKHQKELWVLGIDSPTALIRYWVRQGAMGSYNPPK
jgi:hypothetical protein